MAKIKQSIKTLLGDLINSGKFIETGFGDIYIISGSHGRQRPG